MKDENLTTNKKFTRENNFKKFGSYSELEREIADKIADVAIQNPRALIGLSANNDFANIYENLFDGGNKKYFKKILITLSTEFDDGNETNFEKYSRSLINKLGINKKNINTPLRIGKKKLNSENINKFSNLIMKNNYHDLLLVSFNGKNGAVESIQPSNDPGEIHLLSEIKNVNGIKVASIGLAEILNAKEIVLIAKDNYAIEAISKLFSMDKYDPNFPLSSLLNSSGKIGFYSDLDLLNDGSHFEVIEAEYNTLETNDSNINKELEEIETDLLSQRNDQIYKRSHLEKIEEPIVDTINEITSPNTNYDYQPKEKFSDFEEEDEDFRFHVVNERAELLQRHKILRKKILVISEKANILKIARMQYVDEPDKNNITKATVQIIDHTGKIKGYEEQNLLTKEKDNPNQKNPKKSKVKKTAKKINNNNSKKSKKQDLLGSLVSPVKPGTPPSIGDK